MKFVPYQLRWVNDFQNEKIVIKGIFKESIQLHHIGSTAIPNMFAKPIIDMMMVVSDLEKFDEKRSILHEVGYLKMGERSTDQRRFFQKKGKNVSFHLHVLQKGNPEIERHIALREFMIANVEHRDEYIQLKKDLYKKNIDSEGHYMEGKEKYLNQIDMQVQEWWKEKK